LLQARHPAPDAHRRRRVPGDRVRLRRAGHHQRPLLVSRRHDARLREQQRHELKERKGVTRTALAVLLLLPTGRAAAEPLEVPLWPKGAPGFEARRNEATEAKEYWVK